MRTRLHICALLLPVWFAPLAAQSLKRSEPKPPASPGFVECQGFVYPNRRLVVKLRAGERVGEIAVSKGERVKAGQILARIEDPALFARYIELAAKKDEDQALRDEIEVLSLALTLREANSKRLAARIDKIRKLQESLPNYPVDKDLEPIEDRRAEIEDEIKTTSMRLEHSQTRLRARQASSESIARELETARAGLERTSVKAPFAGVVVARALDPEQLAPEDVICELWDDSAYLIEVEILQHELAYLRVGQPATIISDSGRESVQGAVASIEPGSLVPEVSGHPRFKAIVKIEKTVPWLRPGMQVTVRLRGEGAR